MHRSQPASRPPSQQRSRRAFYDLSCARDEQQQPHGICDETRRQHEGAAQDHECPVGDLVRRQAPLGEGRAKAAPRGKALLLQQPRAQERGDEQEAQRVGPTDGACDSNDHPELRDRQGDEHKDETDHGPQYAAQASDMSSR